MRPKLVIVTEIIAPYRIPVFNALAQRPEIDLHVIFLSENDPTLRQWQIYKDEINFRYDVLPSWRCRLGKCNILLNRGVRSSLKRIKPDAILCGGYNHVAFWEAARWATMQRVPLLLWAESTALDARGSHPLVEFMKQRFLRSCRAVVAAGKSSSLYLRDLGIAERFIFIAPNAVDNDLFASQAEEARQQEDRLRALHRLPSKYFLYMGRLVREKGVFDLLEAYAQLDAGIRAEVGLLFVGDGEDRSDLRERASRIATGTVEFPGFVQREGLAKFYALSDGLIFPTHSDPWGLVVNEAMSCGLPVISTSVAGCVPDLVQDGWNGFVVAPADPCQLAVAMSRLACDPGLRRKMGSRSSERIEANSPKTWAEGLMKAVQFVCAETQ